MPPRPKENVWNYPRPPALQPTAARLKVIWVTPSKQELVIADTTQGYRVLETSHPPTYYFPPSSVNLDLLKASKARRTMCEWKGMAAYHDVQFSKEQGPVVMGRIWSYPQPTPSFSKIKDYLCFYASSQTDGDRLGRWKCMVDDDEVHAQEGDFYGSWITPEITGGDRGFKGGEFIRNSTCINDARSIVRLNGRPGPVPSCSDFAHAPEASSSSLRRDASAAYKNLTFDETLEDMCSRFIVNLPSDELSSIERICFQVEQAHWFYEDFLRPLNPGLSSLGLRRFSSYLLHTASKIVPLIQQYISGGSGQQDLEAAFDDFLKYKTRVPVCGVIMLTEDWKKCLLVKGWKSSAAWGFPKGKINQNEPERDCAIREVLEETGFDCSALLPEGSTDYLDLTMREQKIRLYIVPNVKESTKFETLTRKEISKIAWFKLSDLPTWKKSKDPPAGLGGKFYLISPFIGRLKQWVQSNKHTHDSVQNSASAADFDDIYTSEPKHSSVAASSMPAFVDSSSFFPSSSSESKAGKSKNAPLPAPPTSDHLKALLGLGPPVSAHSATAAVDNGFSGKGAQMIQSTGDERGQQLLSLLSGSKQESATRDTPPSGDSRGQAVSLLNTLNGPSSDHEPSRNDDVAQGLLDMINAQSRSRSPLPAPVPQKTVQAQRLLQMMSSGHDRSDSQNPIDSSHMSSPAQRHQQQQAPAQADALLRMLQIPQQQQSGSASQSHMAPEPHYQNYQQGQQQQQQQQQQEGSGQADALLRMLQGPTSPQSTPAAPRPPPQNDLLSILTAGLPGGQSSANEAMRAQQQQQQHQQQHRQLQQDYGRLQEQQQHQYQMNSPFGFPPPPPHMFPQGMMPFPGGHQPHYGHLTPHSPAHPQSPPAQWGYAPVNPGAAPYSTGPPA